MSDQEWMRRCLELAARGAGRTSPNPLVGCVIVDRKGAKIAEGWHRGPGKPHAEVVALNKAKGSLRGATLYVNLEPCRHFGRTPPCVDAIAESGVRTVVFGVTDPVARHGGGSKILVKRGIRVRSAVLEDECRELNRGFFTVAERGLPFVSIKAAISADGKIATAAGESQWITSEPARARGHRIRGTSDAILVGVGTVLADDPRLTARGPKSARDPIRVVLDSRLRTPLTAAVLPENADSIARCIIATRRDAPKRRAAALEARGAEIWRLPTRGDRVSVRALCRKLAGAGALTVLIEGGAEVCRSAFDADVVGEVLLFVAPVILGGTAPSWVGGKSVKSLDRAHKFSYFGPPQALGTDALLILRRQRTGT